jgi:hypothetical protein
LGNLLTLCRPHQQDTRALMLGFRTNALSLDFMQTLKRVMEGPCFAFANAEANEARDAGWSLRYDVYSEFKRLGARSNSGEGKNAFRITDANASFEVRTSFWVLGVKT